MNRFDITEYIKYIDKLDFKEAKFLYCKNLEEKNEVIREDNLNKIILGTLYFPNSVFKKEELDLVLRKSLDPDDITSVVNMLWMNKINDGELTISRSFNYLLQPTFFNELIENLNIKKINRLYPSVNISYPFFYGLYKQYINKMNQGTILNTDDVKNNATFKIKPELLSHINNNIFPFFDKLSEIKKDNLTYVDSLKFYTYYILSDYYPKLEQKADGYTSDNNLFKDNIEEDIFYKQFSKDVLEVILNKRVNDIIRLHYGLDGDDPMYQEEIARMMQARQYLVSSLEQIAFKTIKKHVKTLTYKPNE